MSSDFSFLGVLLIVDGVHERHQAVSTYHNCDISLSTLFPRWTFYMSIKTVLSLHRMDEMFYNLFYK